MGRPLDLEQPIGGYSRHLVASRTLLPVAWISEARYYAPWSEAEGARVGARALLARVDGLVVDTLRVRWIHDDLACLERATTLDRPLLHPTNANLAQWRIEPLSANLGRTYGTLNAPISSLPNSLDPVYMTSLAEKQVGTQIYVGLVGPPSLMVEFGGAADSASAEGDTWTFRLPATGRFHDGAPLRAGDVVASLARALAPATRAPRVEALLSAIDGARDFHDGRATDIRGIVAPDSLHVTVTAVPGHALEAWAALGSPAAWIVRAGASAGPSFAFEPIGSGPFRFVQADSTGVLLVAAEGRSSGPDTLRFLHVHGPEDAAFQFELGRIDFVAPTEADESRLVPPGPGSARFGQPDVLRQNEAAIYYLGMNSRARWLADRAHRRALAAALDRNLAARVFAPGRSVAVTDFLPDVFRVPHLSGEDWAPPAREAANLARMKPPSPGLALWLPEGSSTGQRIAEYVQATLARQGVRVRIAQKPWREFERGLEAGEADLFYLSWFADSRDPVEFVSAAFDSRRRGSGGNRTGYANARVDSLLDVARAAGRGPAANAALLEAQRIALSDAPLVPLFQSVDVTLVRPYVRGLALDPLGCPRYDTVEITRGRDRTAEKY